MKLFISYRRKSWPFIQLLAEKLGEQVKGDIFIDYTSIDDTDFEKSILYHLGESDIVLVVVTELTFAPERIHNDDDWVRREIALALELKKPLVLIRVDNLLPPPPSQLPQNIRKITRMQGIAFYPEYFDAAVQNLADFIRKVLSSTTHSSKEESSSTETNHRIEPQAEASQLVPLPTQVTNKTSTSKNFGRVTERQKATPSSKEPLTFLPSNHLYSINTSSDIEIRRCKSQLVAIRNLFLFEFDLRQLSHNNIDLIERNLREIIGELEQQRNRANIYELVETIDGIQAIIRKAITNLSLASDFLDKPLTLRSREQVYKKLEEIPSILLIAIQYFNV